MRPVDVRIAALAARQEGVVGHGQLIALPLSRGAIRKRIAAGRLHPVFPGAYSVGVPAARIEAVRVAALLSTAPSFISNRDAGEHHALIDPIPGPVHVTVARHRNLRRQGIIVHRTSHLHADERWIRGPMRVTSPARTLVDLAGDLTARRLSAAFDEGIRIGALTAAEVEAACLRSGGRPGTAALLALARAPHLPFERTRSPVEAGFLRFCREHGLPIPLVNVPLLGYEVDFLWPRHRLVVELDSGHHDHPRARAADAERDRRLRGAGFAVERVRSRTLAERPDSLAAGLREQLARAGVA